MLDYVANWKPTPRRKAVYVGDPAGKSHLESAGVSLEFLPGRQADHRPGPGGGTRRRTRTGRGLPPPSPTGSKQAATLLALGLDQQEANAFLPMKVATRSEEHIASYFEPFGVESLLAGVGPADVHNPAPRKLPLLSGDAAIGNGVLGKAKGANVVLLSTSALRRRHVAGLATQPQANLSPHEFPADATARQHGSRRHHSAAGSLRDTGCRPRCMNAEGRWLEGLYLDVPEEWDDPYRFFRW